MPIDPQQLASFIRFQGAAKELLVSARDAVKSHKTFTSEFVGKQVLQLVEQVRASVPDDLRAEFDNLFALREEGRLFARDVEPVASSLAGWLDGAIQAATLEAQMEANARAYAEAKVKAERGVGFAGPSP